MKLSLNSIKDKHTWESKGIKLPKFDIEAVTSNTKANPTWIHFGAGNIFRGFIASLQQELLNEGLADTGIIAADTFDYEIIDRIFRANDNLTLNVTLNANGTTDSEVIASVVESLKADCDDEKEMARFKEIFTNPSLQMVSYTITEKGYAIKDMAGSLSALVKADIDNGPEKARHAMSFTCALLLERYKAGKYPIAIVSMDNCSHNGEKIQSAVLEIAKAWVDKGYADAGFIEYLKDEAFVSFPWSMIDKITPRPDASVQKMLAEAGVECMEPIVTEKRTFIAPFVNAERPQYLVVEDKFPNSRPALEKAGVYLTDRETVNKTERMKVTTCLNPLHTGLAVYGCLLGYTLICEEMKDCELKKLVDTLGYIEGLPVVTDPGIISPKAFIDEVVNERLPNPFMPDAPQRIATDTSQKVGIRFGETIKSYADLGRTDELRAIPLVIAGWLRYLMGVDDIGNEMAVSSDPLLSELQPKLAGITLGDPESYNGQIKEILANKNIFGSNLCELGMDKLIEEMFICLISGKGAVRETLKKYL